VPSDVGFFVEMRDAADLLTTLTEPQIWSALAEFAGQPARPEDAESWRKQILQTIKMEPAEAIRALFSQRVAFIGDAPGRAQDAVVLCRPPPGTPIKELVVRFKGERLPEPQRPVTYQLHGNIGVAEFDGLLLFGDLLPQNGMFRRIIATAGATPVPRLADDPKYRSLLAGVADNNDGVLFARLRANPPAPTPRPPASQASTTASQPTTQRSLESALPELPGPLKGATAVMVGVRREGRLLHLAAVSDRAPPIARTPDGSRRLITELPEKTLAAWEGRVDYPAIVEAIGNLPQRNVLRTLQDILTRFAAALGRETCLAIGSIQKKDGASGPPVPAVAWLIAARDAETAEAEWHSLTDAAVAAFNVATFRQDVPPLPRAEDANFGGAPGALLDLSASLPARLKAGLGELQLCWAIQENTLIVATHADWLREIVAARAGKRPTLESTIKLSQRKLPTTSENVIVVQNGLIGGVSSAWLDYLRDAAPQVMAESWWRKNQPGGGPQRLGIDVTDDPKQMTVRVVTPGDPADGWLRVGDVLRGANGKRFATSQPWVEMRDAFNSRPHGSYFDVSFERGGERRVARIPLPFFDGVQALRRAVAIGKIADRLVYFDDAPEAAVARGFLSIELTENSRTPASGANQPGSAPTGLRAGSSSPQASSPPAATSPTPR
jgi:hypothetical protein